MLCANNYNKKYENGHYFYTALKHSIRGLEKLCNILIESAKTVKQRGMQKLSIIPLEEENIS